MQNQNPPPAAPPALPAIEQSKMFKLNFFAKFINECIQLIQDNNSSEAGIVRCKLQEANFWAAQAILAEPNKEPAPPIAPPAPPAPPAAPAAPIAPENEQAPAPAQS